MTSVLLDSLASGFDGDASHRTLLDAALRDGLPGPRSEAWKYTSLRALERRQFAPADTLAAAFEDALLADIPAPRIVFVNGRFDARHSALADLPDGVTLQPQAQSLASEAGGLRGADAVFTLLNAALAATGVLLRIAADTAVTTPLHLVFIGAPAAKDSAWHGLHRIELGAGARVQVIEHHLASGEHAHLANEAWQIALADGAQLSHARIQQQSPKATLFAQTDAFVADAAEYRRVDLELGAALSRHALNVRLQGKGARLVANGVLLADGRRHLDARLGIEHLARDTSCDLTWRGLAAERGRAVFHGGITIHAGADGSDANLSNKNLLLSDQAEIDTQPVLEIHADEVKAAHGATVGQLDPTALFYLRSRGISEAQARRLLVDAFCREVVSTPGFDEARPILDMALDRALAGVQAP